MKTQADVFTATMNNFSSAIDAFNVAQNAEGSAMKENDRAMESLAVKANMLKAQFQELVLGDGGLTSIAKLFLELSTNVLEFINNVGGLQTVLATLIGLFISFKSVDTAKSIMKIASSFSNLGKIIPNLITVWQAYITTQKMGAAAMELSGAGAVSLTTALSATIPVIGVLTTAITVLTLGYTKLKQAEEEQQRLKEETLQKAKDEINSLESLEEQINNESLSREDLINLIQGSSISVYEDEISALEDVNEMRQATIDKINEEKLARAQDIVDTGLTDYEEAKTGMESGTEDILNYIPYEKISDFIDIDLESQIKELKEYKDSLIDLRDETEKGSSSYKKYTKQISLVEDGISDLTSKQKDYEDTIEEFENAQDIVNKGLEENTENTENNSQSKRQNVQMTEEEIEQLQSLADELGRSSNVLQQQADILNQDPIEYANSVIETRNAISDLSSELSNITSVYELASDAQAEYAQQGYLSVDTFSQLMSMQPEYLQYLFNEEGQLYNNADAIIALYQARMYELGLKQAEAQIDLASKAMAEGSAYGSLSNAVSNLGNSYEVALASKLKLLQAEAKDDPIKTQSYNNLIKNINAIEAQTRAAMNNVKIQTASYQPTNRNTQATKNNTGAKKANTDATKAQTEALKAHKEALEAEADALESEIDDYETVIDYVKDLLNDEKEAVEEEKDAQLEAIQDKIDAIEDEKDSTLESIDEEIEAIEERKDSILNSIDEEIEAIENERDIFEENIEAQLDALEKQKDEVENYWDSQIDAIQNENEALEENIKLQQLQEAVSSAKTQKVKVLKDGQFVYAEDEEAISKAEQELADYEQELAVKRQIAKLEELKEQALNSLEKQIEELENYRDRTLENYNKQVEDLESFRQQQEQQYDLQLQELENHRNNLEEQYDLQLEDLQNHYNAVEAEYDLRIKQYEQWLKQFEDMLEASSKRHAEILYNELVGEQGNWDARIAALGNFVQRYEAKKNELDGIKSEIEAIDNQIQALQNQARSVQSSVSGIAAGVSNDLNNIRNMQAQAVELSNRKKYGWQIVDKNGNVLAEVSTRFDSEGEAYRSALNNLKVYEKEYGSSLAPYTVTTKVNYYATGTYSVPDDQIALVADPMSPSNRELVVGSKINKGNGILTSLRKGDGVIPAGRNLTENLVNLARWSSGGGFERIFTTMNNSSSKIVNIENINLPEVKDGNDFVQYLQNNFMNDSIQFSNIRG